ncbi:MAG: exodeoxyribonuclease VII small subunit [Actinobacteria bacterium]|nr:exodeoxyribonuclease VII small subunit [Actinomycetota bacterium]
MEELEKITNSLEGTELELEKSLELFERGVELIKYCQRKLDTAESRVDVLVDSLEGGIEAIPEEVEEEAGGEKTTG